MDIAYRSLTVAEILAIYGIRVHTNAPWFKNEYTWGEPPSNTVFTRRAKKAIYHRSQQDPDDIDWELILHEGVHLILQRLNLEVEEDEIEAGVFALQYFITKYIESDEIYSRSLTMLREVWRDWDTSVTMEQLAQMTSQRLLQLGLIDKNYNITWQRPNHASRIHLKAA